MEKSLYDQIGGFSSLRKVVLDFYELVLENDEVSPFFAETNMLTQIDHQTKFIATILGGPASYTDEQLRKIHTKMDISDDHFDTIVDLLTEAFEDNNFDQEYIEAIVTAFQARRGSIVTLQRNG